jgi:hypothetical protein
MDVERSCAWCGSPKPTASDSNPFCEECGETFDTEASHSLHPVEIRHSYED